MAIDTELQSILDGCNGEFKPYHEISQESDSLTVYLEPDADYTIRLCDHVTLYLSLEDDDIVGCRIKGISGILNDLPNYVHVEHGRISLSMIFWSFRSGLPDDKARDAMSKLARAAKGQEMTFEPAGL